MKKAFFLLIAVGTFFSCAAKMANISWDLETATRPGYGYTAEDPIRMGYSGNLQKNINLCHVYLASLRTSDQQPLLVVYRVSVKDPVNEPEQSESLGLPMRNSYRKGGILDLYVLAPAVGSDTVQLYFDIYHKDSLRVPKGLQFVSPAPAQ
jgi:hypothetical protein